ncbi:MAG: hypothetical protein U1E14_13970 [Geminicoccaceae bacterium]
MPGPSSVGRILRCLLAALPLVVLAPPVRAQTVTSAVVAPRVAARLTLEWPGPVTVRRTDEGLAVRLRFSQPVAADLAARARGLGRWLDGVAPGLDPAEIVLWRVPDVGVALSLDAGRVVIDLVAGAAPAAVPEATAADAESVPASATWPPTPSPRPAGLAAATPGPAAGPEPAAGPPDAAETPRFAVRKVKGGAELAADWPAAVPAAAFVRGGVLWLVFGAEAPPDAVAALAGDAAARPWLGPVEALAQPGFTVLRLRPTAPVRGLERRGGSWRLRLGKGAPAAVRPVIAWPLPEGRLVIRDAAAVVELDDPVVGDRLGVALMSESGRGETLARSTVDLEILPSLQGVAWRARADDVTVRPTDDGVVVARAAEEPMLPAPPAEVAAAAPAQAEPHGPAPAAAEPDPDLVPLEAPEVAAAAADRAAVAPAGAEPAPVAGAAASPIDLVAQVLPAGTTARDRRRQLEEAVVAAAPAPALAARLDLARFLLAQGLAIEAEAALPGDGETVPDTAADSVAALRGVAAFLDGRAEEAAPLLDRTGLDGDPEAALWRAVVAEARGDPAAAADSLARSDRVVLRYPPVLRLRLVPAVATIQLASGATDAALATLDRLRDLPLEPGTRAGLRLLEAEALARQGATREAEAAWTAAEAEGDAVTRLSAGLGRLRDAVARGVTGPGDAAARLAAERGEWRGHPDEAAMLVELGRLRAAAGDPVAALEAWQDAGSRAVDPAGSRQVRRLVEANVAAAITGEGGSVASPPLPSLAFYRRFADLLPTGPALAELERKLALRLAVAGYAGPAQALVDRHPEPAGSAVPRLEATLAVADGLLAEGEPADAVARLQAVGPDEAVPAGLAQRRRLLLGRALVAAGDPAAALAAVEADRGADADRIRLAAAWRLGDWEAVAAASATLLADGTAATAPGMAEIRMARALALARLGRLDELVAMAAAPAGSAAEPVEPALLAMLAPASGGGEPGAAAVAAYLDRAGSFR